MPYRASSPLYRLLSLLLALLWGMLTLLGSAQMARSQTLASSCASRARLACRCSCRGMKHGGIMPCCLKKQMPANTAGICSCCHPRQPQTAAVLLWSPQVLLADTHCFSVLHPRLIAVRAISHQAVSWHDTPPLRPPCFL